MTSFSSQRLRILDMVADGKLSAEEGARLLETLKQPEESVLKHKPITKTLSTGMVLIRVIEKVTENVLVSLRLPISLISTAQKLGAKITSHDEEYDLSEFMTDLRSGHSGDIFRVDGEKEIVEIVID